MKRSIAGFGFTLPVGLTASSICCLITRYFWLYRFHPPHMPASIAELCHGWSRMLWKVLFDASHSSTASRSLCQTREEEQAMCCREITYKRYTEYTGRVRQSEDCWWCLNALSFVTYLYCAALSFSSRVTRFYQVDIRLPE